MRLFLLAVVTMTLFAANSLLTRAGVAAGSDPLTFALIRVAAGSMTLAALAMRARGHVPLRGRARGIAAGALALYLIGFSMAYLTLDAGVGALILFGVVQIGLFGGAVATAESVGPRRWAGMAVAVAALTWLLWPSAGAQVPLSGAAWMTVGGIGWALYTWQGRSEPWALGGTAGNFIWATLPLIPLALWLGGPITGAGLGYAVASGVVASGLGYAFWFAILPQIRATTAGLTQLSVPVIAVLGGALLLGEVVQTDTLLACAGVLGGIALATVQLPRRR